MSSPGAQTITVRHEGTDRVFDSTQHVTMGRAPEVLLFVDSPLVSRVHATLTWQGSNWILSDNGSTNGVFVDAQRLAGPVPIERPTLVRLGDAITGPLLHLVPDAARQAPPPQRPAPPRGQTPPEGQRQRPSGQTPPEGYRQPPSGQRPQAPQRPPNAPQRPQSSSQHPQAPQRPQPPHGRDRTPPRPDSPPRQPVPAAMNVNMTTKADTSALPPIRARASTAPVARADRIPAGGLTIGRTSDNQIVVNDPLASRRHARLVKGSEGLVLEDVGSANGTFVNGRREQRVALRERDIVTIGNVDFVVQEGTLKHRKKPVTEQGLHVHGVGFTVEGNKQLLIDVNMQAGRGTLTALIGPSGAGKSTLSKLIAGSTHPSAGVVTFEGRNLHAEYEAMRSRIGMVPQDDVLHRQLTVRQALGFAAELRLPPDSSKADRQQVIDGVLKELSLTEHADTRVDKLSGGQRKRASVALELLTGPALLLLDEPTSGLDPALDRQVMTMLRELADAGRTVIVVTHSVACLDMCDQVLLLAPGGKTAFCGHPATVGDFLGTSDWADIFARVAADPDRAFAHYRSRQAAATPPPPPVAPRGVSGQPPKSSGWKQFSTLSRRQVRLILADRGYLAFLVVLPFVLGVLSLVVPGENGFAPGVPVPLPDGTFVLDGGGETQQLLVVLILGACFMGSTLTVRDLVGERPIFFRERAVGLLPSAYLLAKVAIFGIAALLQSAVLVAIVLAGKNAPGKGALIPSGSVELYFDLAFTAVACVVIGLLLSTVAKSNEQVMPLLVVMIMCQLVMAGGMIPVTDRIVLEQLSYVFPSRWGFASGAATVDLRYLFANAQPDAIWQHKAGFWLLDIGMLLVITAVLTVLTWWRLRLKKTSA
ncbi:FHA domain-containing protein [Nocardia blacklockiae]|uniref:FHA domain-containing protein n=1 Tax=Nocardia blacklockiae TaxID=480036 RepID=UPI001896109A|nr:FHA domain-containing protein [Nocardia blacklockiae]MBF6172630.1 ATP-binding cassette domain-containing protein [Nocardia blacklockiae]